MTNINKKEFKTVLELAKIASKEIRKIYYGSSKINIETKLNDTPVTNADKLANKIILEGLSKHFPNDGIVSEEDKNIEGTSGRIWYIDPIDGTKGFIKRTDHFSIHVGRADNSGNPDLGLIYKPTSNEFFYALSGQGAYRVGPSGNEVPLRVDKNEKGSLDLVVNMSFDRQHLDFLKEIIPGKDPIKHGGAGLRAMKVLENVADVYIHGGGDYNTWDLCAPHAIAKEAGAYVADLDGNELIYQGQRNIGKKFVMARTKELGQSVAEIFKKYQGG